MNDCNCKWLNLPFAHKTYVTHCTPTLQALSFMLPPCHLINLGPPAHAHGSWHSARTNPVNIQWVIKDWLWAVKWRERKKNHTCIMTQNLCLQCVIMLYGGSFVLLLTCSLLVNVRDAQVWKVEMHVQPRLTWAGPKLLKMGLCNQAEDCPPERGVHFCCWNI